MTPNNPDTMRIAYVVRRFPSLSQSFVLNEIRCLERAGHRVRVLSLERPRATELALIEQESAEDPRRSVAVYARPRAASTLVALIWAIRRHPRRLVRTLAGLMAAGSRLQWRLLAAALVMARDAGSEGVEHLHAHLGRGSEAAWLAHRLTGVGYSFTAHARDIYVRGDSLTQRLADATFAVTVCEYNRVRLEDWHPPAASKIHVIHPFLAPGLLRDPPAGLGPSDAALRVICVCRLTPKKGVVILIDALRQLLDRRVEVRLTVIGDGSLRADLSEQVRALDLEANVSLVGCQAPAAVRAALAASDCFALASVEAADGDIDATPTVLGEAMAMGLPVISTRLSGIPEIVPEGAGLLVPPDDPSALANAIAEVAALPAQRRAAMGACGRAFVQAHWNPNKDVHRLLALFQSARQHPDRGRA